MPKMTTKPEKVMRYTKKKSFQESSGPGARI